MENELFETSLKRELRFEARWKFNYFFARENLYVPSMGKDFFLIILFSVL